MLVSEPSTLAHVIETDLKGYKRDRTLYKPVDSRDFTEFLSQQFEDTKTRGEGTRTNKRVKTMVVLGSGKSSRFSPLFLPSAFSSLLLYLPPHLLIMKY